MKQAFSLWNLLPDFQGFFSGNLHELGDHISQVDAYFGSEFYFLPALPLTTGRTWG